MPKLIYTGSHLTLEQRRALEAMCEVYRRSLSAMIADIVQEKAIALGIMDPPDPKSIFSAGRVSEA